MAEAAAPATIVDERVAVHVRIRPHLPREDTDSVACTRLDDKTIHVVSEDDAAKSVDMKGTFDHIHNSNVTQEAVFQRVHRQVDCLFEGYNSTIFAYGQTGTGKTYTMSGLHAGQDSAGAGVDGSAAADKREFRGLIPRAMERIFQHVSRVEGGGSGVKCTVLCSYIELYSEQLRDLLAGIVPPADGAGVVVYDAQRAAAAVRKMATTVQPKMASLDIKEEMSGEVYVPDLSEVSVSSVADVMSLIKWGNRTRQVRQTEMNEHSSRSHTILQVVLEESRDVVPAASDGGDSGGPTHKSKSKVIKRIKRAKLNMVDLAGSEKWKTQAAKSSDPTRFNELAAINLSLSMLASCVHALSEDGRVHIPYRDSKLTRLLQDSLGGNSKTLFMVTVSPAADAVGETISSLKFAERASRVSLHVQVNEVEGSGDMLAQRLRHQAEINKLRRTIAQLEDRLNKEAAGSRDLRRENAALQDIISGMEDQQRSGVGGRNGQMNADYGGGGGGGGLANLHSQPHYGGGGGGGGLSPQGLSPHGGVGGGYAYGFGSNGTSISSGGDMGEEALHLRTGGGGPGRRDHASSRPVPLASHNAAPGAGRLGAQVGSGNTGRDQLLTSITSRSVPTPGGTSMGGGNSISSRMNTSGGSGGDVQYGGGAAREQESAQSQGNTRRSGMLPLGRSGGGAARRRKGGSYDYDAAISNFVDKSDAKDKGGDVPEDPGTAGDGSSRGDGHVVTGQPDWLSSDGGYRRGRGHDLSKLAGAGGGAGGGGAGVGGGAGLGGGNDDGSLGGGQHQHQGDSYGGAGGYNYHEAAADYSSKQPAAAAASANIQRSSSQKLLATSSQNSVGATNASAAASNVKPPLSSKSVDSSGGIKRNDPGYVSPRALALASQYNTYNVQKSAAKKKNTVPVWLDMEEGSIPKPPTYYDNASNKTPSSSKKAQEPAAKEKEKPAKKKYDYDSAIASFQKK